MWRVVLLLLCTLLPIAACAGNGDDAPVTANSTAHRFLALGDSYTIGESVPARERWPVRLTALLAAEGIEVHAPQIIARTGWTTAELAAGVEEANLDGPYGLVSLLIGVNNQYRGLSSERYREEFRALLAQAVGFAGGAPSRVIVLSIPDSNKYLTDVTESNPVDGMAVLSRTFGRLHSYVKFADLAIVAETGLDIFLKHVRKDLNEFSKMLGQIYFSYA